MTVNNDPVKYKRVGRARQRVTRETSFCIDCVEAQCQLHTPPSLMGAPATWLGCQRVFAGMGGWGDRWGLGCRGSRCFIVVVSIVLLEELCSRVFRLLTMASHPAGVEGDDPSRLYGEVDVLMGVDSARVCGRTEPGDSATDAGIAALDERLGAARGLRKSENNDAVCVACVVQCFRRSMWWRLRMFFSLWKQVVDANDNSVASVINMTPGEWAMMPSGVQLACVLPIGERLDCAFDLEKDTKSRPFMADRERWTSDLAKSLVRTLN